MFGFGKNKRLEAELQAVRTELAEIRADASGARLGDLDAMRDLFGASASASGVLVTRESAMRQSAVYACVRILGGALASLPLPVYQKGVGDKPRVRAGWHFADELLNAQPNAMMTAAVFWEFSLAAMLLGGDGVSVIDRDRSGKILGFLPLATGEWDSFRRQNGRIGYQVTLGGASFTLDQDDVLHFPTIGFNGLRSPSAIKVGAQAIGLGLAAEEFGASVFKNGGRPDVVISYEGKVSEDQADLLRKYWMEKHSGLANAHMPAVIGAGGKVTPLSISNEDAQLLDTRRFQIEDIARIFGVPAHMIGHTEKTTSWGSGIEQQGIAFVLYTLRPHITRIEQEINRKVFRLGNYFCEFNPEGLMRGDSKAEADYFKAALGGSSGPGWMTQNEVRRVKNMPPIDGGDTLTKWEKAGAKPADQTV